MEQEFIQIAIKIGSNVLAHHDGTLDVTRMLALVGQVAELNKFGVEIILISSGTVASRCSGIHPQRKLDSIDQRQLFSAVGRAKLINRYYELSREHGATAGQVLITKENPSIHHHYLNQKNCTTVMPENGIIPIANGSDTVSASELMSTDNDELSGLIASMMDAQALIILNNIDRVYNGSPLDPTPAVICKIKHGKDLSNYIQATKSNLGRGGILTEMNIARKIADEGTIIIIVNGKRDSILTDLLQQPDDTVCTRFIPSTEAVPSVRKQIAYNEGFVKREIHINECTTDILSPEKAASILPVGITYIEGEFEKDDIIRIMGSQGGQVGVRKASCDSTRAGGAMGKYGKKPVIHCDYLYIG